MLSQSGNVISPPAIGELVECLINRDWRERGQAAVWVVRRAPSRKLSLATFFIDTWCAGLKKAWGWQSAHRDGIDAVVECMQAQMDNSIGPVDLDEVRAVVLGGARFAEQNGFILPEDCGQWLAFLGEPVDYERADLSGFSHPSGKLVWFGPVEDLQSRLNGMTVKQFAARPDVECHFDEALADDEECLPQMEAVVEELTQIPGFGPTLRRGVESVRRWCFANGVAPAEMLTEAMVLAMIETLRAEVINRGGSSAGALLTDFDAAINELSEAEYAALKSASDQVRRFITSSPEAMEMMTGAAPRRPLPGAHRLPHVPDDDLPDDLDE